MTFLPSIKIEGRNKIKERRLKKIGSIQGEYSKKVCHSAQDYTNPLLPSSIFHLPLIITRWKNNIEANSKKSLSSIFYQIKLKKQAQDKTNPFLPSSVFHFPSMKTRRKNNIEANNKIKRRIKSLFLPLMHTL
jgi:hypothetical protein